jgi:hypothetical protein
MIGADELIEALGQSRATENSYTLLGGGMRRGGALILLNTSLRSLEAPYVIQNEVMTHKRIGFGRGR